MKKIKIIAMCNVDGKPAEIGEELEVDEIVAEYLVSIGRALEIAEKKLVASESRPKSTHKAEVEETD